MEIRAALLITSDRIARCENEDVSGVVAWEILSSIAGVIEKKVVPDEPGGIRDALLQWCERGIDLIVTIGGTGLGPRDVTADVTRSVIEKEARGISNALLVKGLASTPRAMLSSAAAGVRGRTLIINLPGSKLAARELLEYLSDVIPHALEMIRGGGHPGAEDD